MIRPELGRKSIAQSEIRKAWSAATAVPGTSASTLRAMRDSFSRPAASWACATAWRLCIRRASLS